MYQAALKNRLNRPAFVFTKKTVALGLLHQAFQVPIEMEVLKPTYKLYGYGLCKPNPTPKIAGYFRLGKPSNLGTVRTLLVTTFSTIPAMLHPIVFQIPLDKVFLVCFWGPNTSSPGVWKPRDRTKTELAVPFSAEMISASSQVLTKCCWVFRHWVRFQGTPPIFNSENYPWKMMVSKVVSTHLWNTPRKNLYQQAIMGFLGVCSRGVL